MNWFNGKKTRPMDKDCMLEKVRILLDLMNAHATVNTALKNEISTRYTAIDAFDESTRSVAEKMRMLADVGILVGQLDDNERHDQAIQAEVDCLYVALDALENLPADTADITNKSGAVHA